MANEFKIRKGLIVTGASGGTVVDIQGSQGQLFSVTDDLSGSIFAVSDISGVPIFDVNSSGLSTFDGLVSGITPVNAANFVTKAYVDGSGGGTGPFLPLAGGTMTGDFLVDGAITIEYGGDTLVEGVLEAQGGIEVTGDGSFTGDVTAPTFIGNVTGNLTGIVTATSSLADGVTGTTQGDSDDSELIATTAFVQNLIETIPAGLVFQGTWNAATNTPTLTSGSGTTGNFYIVSVAGSTNLDGITDWKVGDWAVFIEQGASDQWEKIDNSSVLDGIGTGQSVTKWDGSGTSNTLTDGPITFSTNDSTFAGDISTSGNIYLNNNKTIFGKNTSGSNYGLLTITSGNIIKLGAYAYTSAATQIGLGDNGAFLIGTDTALSINNSKNATFAGDVTVNGGDLTINAAVNAVLNVNGTGFSFIEKDTGTDLYIANNVGDKDIKFRVKDDTTNVIALTIDGSEGGNATFAGTVTSPTFLGDLNGTINTATTGTTQSAGNNSTLIATTAYADAAAGAVPIGNYLPLSAGPSYPLTGVLYIGGTIRNSSGDLEIRNQTATGFATATKLMQQTVNGLETFLTFDGTTRAAYFSNQGNVGIGTTGPTSKLTIADTAFTTAYDSIKGLFFDNSNISSGDENFGAGIEFGKLSNGGNLYKKAAIIPVQSGTDSDQMGISFFVSNTVSQASPVIEAMRVDYGGNVGIGTTSPVAKLDVLGTANGPTVFDYAYATSAGLRIHGDESAMDIVGTDSGNHASTILLRNGNEGFGLLNNPTLNTLQFRSFTATADGFSIHNTGSELSSLVDIITLEKTGNVGIGTTNPAQNFVVADATLGNGIELVPGATGTLQAYDRGASVYVPFNIDTLEARVRSIGATVFNNGSGFSESMRITSAGDVGIGVTAPVAKLHVADTNKAINSEGNLFVATTDDYAIDKGGQISLGGVWHDTPLTIEFAAIAGRKANSTNGSAGGYLQLSTSLSAGGTMTEKMRITQDGKVGIGTDSPSEKLDVRDGTITSRDSGNVNYAELDRFSGLILKGNGAGAKYISTPNTDALAFSTNSSERMRITSSGNVGIGTTTPLAKLDIQGTQGQLFSVTDDLSGSIFAVADISGVPIFDVNSSGVSYFDGEVNIGRGTNFYTLNVGATSSGSIYTDGRIFGGGDFYVAGEAIFNGDVGIGTTNPSFGTGGGLQITNATQANLRFTDTSASTFITDLALSNDDFYIINRAASGQLKFRVTASNEAMTIDSSGNVGIGTTTNTTIPLHVNTTSSSTVFKASGIAATIEIQSATAGNATIYQRPNTTGDKEAEFRCTLGSTYGWSWKDDNATSTSRIKYMKLDQNPGTLTVKGDVVAYGSPSDKSLKENIKPIDSALDKVMKLQGVTFDWKPKEDVILDIKEDIGFIAQDVQKVVPELIRKNSNGLLSMRHQGVTPILLEAIKELKAEIDLLKSKPCTCNKCNCNI